MKHLQSCTKLQRNELWASGSTTWSSSSVSALQTFDALEGVVKESLASAWKVSTIPHQCYLAAGR